MLEINPCNNKDMTVPNIGHRFLTNETAEWIVIRLCKENHDSTGYSLHQSGQKKTDEKSERETSY